MKVFLLLVAFCFIELASSRIVDREVDAKEVCYEHYECFRNDNPWRSPLRPFAPLPNPPYEVGTRFLLFTRGSHETEEIGYELLPDKDVILRFSDFNATRKTYVLVHGFTDNHKVDWMWNTKNLLLQNEDVNVLAVDWAPGARPPYVQATGNARMAGAMIARMLTYLEQKADLKADDIHIISHSLGGHVAGYAGSALLGRIARITAIDPMNLYFRSTHEMVRLDTTDARVVEIIHSNADTLTNLGLGIPDNIGHVDIYPNGGAKQPGCRDTLGNLIASIIDLLFLNFDGAISTWACSHARAAHFYAESISAKDDCPFVSFQCKSYSDFQKGNCYQFCSEPGKCVPLGYNAKKHSEASGVYYLRTTDGANNRSYCKQVVQLQVPISVTQQQTTGSLTLIINGEDGSKSDKFTLADNVRISPGQILQLWVEVPRYILRSPEDKPSITLRYVRGGLLPGNQAKTLELDGVNLVVIRPDLTTSTTTYGGVTLPYATNTVISD